MHQQLQLLSLFSFRPTEYLGFGLVWFGGVVGRAVLKVKKKRRRKANTEVLWEELFLRGSSKISAPELNAVEKNSPRVMQEKWND